MPLRFTLPRICIALGISDPVQLLEHADREAAASEPFLEFRLDYLSRPEQGLDVIRTVLERHPGCSILATCRRHQNHGKFNGGIEDQIRILEAGAEAGAQAVDLEIETAEMAGDRLQSLRSHAKLVVSYHNFESTPNLDAVLKRMTHVPADIYKVVTTARKPSDCGRVLALARSNPRIPLVVLAMGETGFATRVLSTSFNGLYTYAAPASADGTAAGQVSAHHLRRLYRVDKLSKGSRIYGVIADPVRHSISPAVHNRAFQARRLDSVYLPFLVAPAQLKDFVDFAGSLPVAGFSVTIPHKQKIIRYLDAVEPLARRIGAVNTVWRKAGKWRGTNTDAAGVTVPLSRHLRPARASVLIAGNGGAARGAACALIDAGAKVTLTGRNPDRVRALAKACGAEPLARDQVAKHKFDAVVHSTSVGMYPHLDGCFFEDEIPADIVFDMVYNPLETTLIRRAREQKKIVIPGIEMFIEQAVRQFEIWTGESAPLSAMEKAAHEALQCRKSGD
ncbi:MAG TPA: shikimate dehydrogenase [Bryobacteraceae bacterium]|jgi:3-dehydroquinate dehydratase/shikimate dehydrogenase|nr:shikimate dehydrogenase [Bryobacteraceae bacterium]